MEAMEKRVYHCERPYREAGKKTERSVGRKKIIDMVPEDMSWRSLISNGLCLGMESPCVVGECDVMCAYGRRYISEKEQHAG